MKSSIFSFVFISLMALSFGQDGVAETKLTEVTTGLPVIEDRKPTLPGTKLPSTTQPPTTTQVPTSTHAPAPTTTTVPSTTPTPVTSSSTAPTPTPTPSPKPKPWDWDVGKNGTVCILAKMNINLDLKRVEEHRDVVFNVPKNAIATGLCDSKQQALTLTWDMKTNSSNSSNMLTFWFQKNDTSKNYYINRIEVKLYNKNIDYNGTKYNLTMYETKENTSYSCSYSSPIEIKTPNNTLTISLSDIHLQAYLNDSAATANFRQAYSCAPDSPDLVPILVGVALTLLIITVLIAYLYSRKRNQARGYLSM